MSKVFIEEETLIGIGNAIREKNGTTDLIATTDMATAISNLPTGGGTAYADLWYSINTKTLSATSNQSFDVSNASKFVFDYTIKVGSSSSARTKWTLTAYKGYNISPSSNTYSPTAGLTKIDDNATTETLLSAVSTNSTNTIEIDVSDYSCIAFEISASATTSGSYSYVGYLHLSNIHTE